MTIDEWLDEHNQHYFSWLEDLRAMDSDAFFQPIAEGKWSPAAIVMHMAAWDHYTLDDRIPQIREGVMLEKFPDFQQFNEQSWKKADSGLSQNEIIDEARNERELLMETVRTMDQDKLKATFSIGDHSMTTTGYITGFAGHDRHHMKQIGGVN
ncbi:DinB family protein [Jeotgalibacillus haloalkalitolerans]|uniref:DinB family protein n=1 Tax=Jeotgalibacillus haloalkalitolerans TaxID=3104292 RepID=A0ABU5KRT9_9BACL|nr:DinB family protein [Jeotgalibacillus sp. HH7-29]MDZ5713803.1 DinB family protein [Jeotgalibacillus sp. HH7-29]